MVLARAAHFLDPANVFNGEKGRGMLTSIAAGAVTNGIYALSVGHLGLLSVEAGIIVILTLFGNILAYSLDIVFAKRNFRLPGSKVIQALPYNELLKRARYLVRSYGRKQFFRFGVTAIIDAMFTVSVVKAVTAYLEKRKILTSFKYRDSLVAISFTVINFFLFLNILRFDWAYQDGNDPMFNIVVLMWMALSIMTYALYKTTELRTEDGGAAGEPKAAADVATIGRDIANHQ
jgi:hypothetical protein